MRSLWFKQKYVVPILSGEKASTIRKKSNRNPSVGETVKFTVGIRPPFAYANISSIEPLDPKALSKVEIKSLKKIYGDLNNLIKISFVLVPDK